MASSRTPETLSGAVLWSSSRWVDGDSDAGTQLGFDDLGTPLAEATFVVVDLETTGGSASADAITEIGAVKVRGGEILGEFQTLVNPGTPIPPYITVLTGITTSMVIEAPKIAEVLPAFMEFAAGAILVAHNANFDVGFLKAAARSLDYPWPNPRVVDTVALARKAVPRSEVSNHKLATLASHFHATTTPDHRALSDARATVDVLHALFGRLAAFGITHVEDLADISRPVPPARMKKRTLADDVPSVPGVYIFVDGRGEALYVGTSGNLRKRVRSYFTAAEKRTRIHEMVMIADRVETIECATPLEAQIRELRLIDARQPRYNRRSRDQGKELWVKLTVEPFPRLTTSRDPVSDDPVLGPFSSRGQAVSAIEAIHSATPVRQCTKRLPRRPSANAAACILLDMGRCPGPCLGIVTPDAYREVIEEVTSIVADDPSPLVEAIAREITRYAEEQRYEAAADDRDRVSAFLSARIRSERLRPFAACPEIITARRLSVGGWELVAIRYGRFAGTLVVERGVDPVPRVDMLRATAEHVEPPESLVPRASYEEIAILKGYVDDVDVRLVHVDGDWVSPRHGAGRFGSWVASRGNDLPRHRRDTA